MSPLKILIGLHYCQKHHKTDEPTSQNGFICALVPLVVNEIERTSASETSTLLILGVKAKYR